MSPIDKTPLKLQAKAVQAQLQQLKELKAIISTHKDDLPRGLQQKFDKVLHPDKPITRMRNTLRVTARQLRFVEECTRESAGAAAEEVTQGPK